MCYDISFTIDIPQLSDYFPDMIFDEQLELNFDGVHIMGHAFGLHPVLYINRDDNRIHCRSMEWGCIPYYIKDEKAWVRNRSGMLNARSERILEDTKSYWYKIRNRRCLIPVSGFYEHREIKGWKKKVPYFIRLKSEPLFFIPGLYSVAELPDRETGEFIKRWTFTLITRSANAVMARIHNSGENKGRMPLMLPFDMAMEWVATDLDEQRYRDILHFEMPPEALDFHPVFTIRSPKPRPDDQPKNTIWQWENLPALDDAGSVA